MPKEMNNGNSPNGKPVQIACSLLGTLLILFAFATGCNSQPSEERFAEPIEKSHGLDAWRSHRAFQTGISVEFGGSKIFDEAMMMFTTDGGKVRMETKDGVALVFDGKDAWVSPASADFPQARFHLLTWPYFLAVPFKLSDPGVNLSGLGEKELNGKPHAAAKMTFDPGTGDSPDDWYVVYRNPETERLSAMAYIVTYGTSLEKAEREPHAIVYDDFVDVEGATVPTTWMFYNWNETQGVNGEPIGKVKLSQPHFITPPADAFNKPADAKRDDVPGS